MDINKAIKTAMLNKDIRQIAVADKMGMSESQYSQLIKRSDLKIRVLRSIADAIGYDVKIQLVDRDTGKVIDIE